MRVLIAPDKFKGSLTAAQAAAALAEGWREGWPVDKPLEIQRLPVADGGEGTAEAIHDGTGSFYIGRLEHAQEKCPNSSGRA